MADEKLLFAVFIFLAPIFILEIQSIEGRYLKFDSEKLNSYKRFLTKIAKVAESRSSLHAAYVEASASDKLQPPPAARLATGAVVGASQAPPQRHATNFRPAEPGHGLAVKAYVEAGDAKVSYPPPPPYIGHRWFSDEKKDISINPSGAPDEFSHSQLIQSSFEQRLAFAKNKSSVIFSYR